MYRMYVFILPYVHLPRNAHSKVTLNDLSRFVRKDSFTHPLIRIASVQRDTPFLAMQLGFLLQPIHFNK